MGGKEKEKQVTVSVTLEIVLTQEDIDDIMCGALEGGITYWCDEAKVVGDYLGEYGSEQIARGGKLRLHLPEPFDKDETEYYELDLEKFKKGVELWAITPVGCNCLEQMDGTLYVIRKKKKEKKVLTPEEEAKKQNMRNKKQIKAILKEAANTRKAFIEGILSGRIKKVTDEKQVEADLFEQMMDWETFTGHNKLIEFFVGCEVYNAPEEEKEAARKKMQGLSVLQKLLCLVSAMVADADLVEWNYTYNTVKGEKVKAFYGILEQYGFQFPNDEEKGVVEGTSDLYVKKEGAK